MRDIEDKNWSELLGLGDINYDVPLDGRKQNANIKLTDKVNKDLLLELGFTINRENDNKFYYINTVYKYKSRDFSSAVTFNVSIDLSDKSIQIDVLDECILQPYNVFQDSANYNHAVIQKIRYNVYNNMRRLTKSNVIEGWNWGDYI